MLKETMRNPAPGMKIVTTRATEVVPNLYQLPLISTGAFLLLEEQITIIDAGWRVSGRRVLEYLDYLGRSPQEISYILSTHYHLDHIGGIAHIQERSAGRVAVHESEVPFVQGSDGKRFPNPACNPMIGFLMSPIFSLLRPRQFSVDIPLQDGSRLDLLGGMEVVHSPGHTPGSISLYFPQQGLLMVGDALQCRRGKLELPSRWFSTNMAQAKESVRRLAQLDFEVLCFSHFPPIKKGAARALRQFAETL
jgi:glyoxylase-like metal-dependent hydrolase (beta-lactamase superfamily II)